VAKLIYDPVGLIINGSQFNFYECLGFLNIYDKWPAIWPKWLKIPHHIMVSCPPIRPKS